MPIRVIPELDTPKKAANREYRRQRLAALTPEQLQAKKLKVSIANRRRREHLTPEQREKELRAKRESEKKRMTNLSFEEKSEIKEYAKGYYQNNKGKRDKSVLRDKDKKHREKIGLTTYNEKKQLQAQRRRESATPEMRVLRAAARRERREKEKRDMFSDPVLLETHRAASRARSQKSRDTQTNEQRLHINALNRGRKARQAGAEGRYTADDVERITKSQRGKCAICGKPLGKKLHVDHIIPIAKGGSNWPKNLQVTHPKCNVAKSSIDPIVFMRRLGKLL
jgi:5-methylcytosine-specific restriction endonuclease McrA